MENQKKRSLKTIIRFILGSYTPPGFLIAIYRGFKDKHIQTGIKSGFLGFFSMIKRHKLISGILIAAVILVIVGFSAWRIWKLSQPQLITVSYSFSSPTPTNYETGDIYPFRVSFRGSAAKLEEVGKEPNIPIEMNPEIKGSWLWEEDDKLIFTPDETWTIGETYKVKFPKEFFPEHIKIDDLAIEFNIQEFNISITKGEFYIDPQDGTVKRVLATIRGNYPLDEKSIEENIVIKPKLKADSGQLQNKDYSYSMSLSDDRMEAYIVSEPLGMPADNTTMEIIIQPGIVSVYGGREISKEISFPVTVPGASSYVKVNSITHQLIKNDQLEYEQVFIINTKDDIDQNELRKNLSAWILPVDLPALPGLRGQKDHRWGALEEMVPKVLNLSTKLESDAIPNELELSSFNSFRIDVDPSRFIYIKLNAGTKFFGDYYLSEDYETIFRVKDYPREISILSEGAILSMTGDKRLSMLGRGVNNVNYTIKRIRPDDINHLVSQSNGNINSFNFRNYRFNEDNISESYHKESKISNSGDPQELTYFSFDFSDYLSTISQKNLRYGLFFFHVIGDRPYQSYSDKRLVMVTDLGFLVKSNDDGTKDLFVQSIATGHPVPNARVDVLGKNGNPIVSAYTAEDGHVHFPILSNYKNEHEPTVYIIRKGNDLSFMPYTASGRKLDYSNFDVGGIHGAQDPKTISAYLFSDRGIYRPGDQLHIGMIVKAGDWNINLANTPLECIITDPTGLQIFTKPIQLSSEGFEEISYTTEDYSPTGMYKVSLFVIKENDRKHFLGSTTVKVEEFLPDTLNITTSFLPDAGAGWVSPENLQGKVLVNNLFGTPAAGNKVKLQLTLSPGYQRFRKYSDYQFFDPLLKDKRYEEYLGDFITDDTGAYSQDIDLSKFDTATYNVKLYVEVFEKSSGRNVSSEASIIVSPLDYLVGKKVDGDTNYINKDSERKINFIAISPDLKQRQAEGLTLQINETRYISALVRQPNGVFKYQSVKKIYPVTESDFSIPAEGIEINLPTDRAGEFTMTILNKEGTVLSKTNYSVVGYGNIQRSLDRTAELELKLNNTDFKPGQEIEIFIKAPYPGGGLITIERDKVYSYKWFKTTGEASTQRIRVPEELEGNGYVTVTLIRDLDSKEIYMSPLSYGVEPFSVSKERRINSIQLDIPEEAKPGEPFPITFQTAKPGKIVIFAVDEGILQVARYNTPDPISFFFKKRALEVGTAQILDLILPEFSVVQSLAAMGGGGGDDSLSRHLNPFKRKQNVPVAYWSGVLDTGPVKKTVSYTIPDYFNGTLRVMAVTVSPDSLGAVSEKALIRSPYVIQPNAPTLAAPGDEIDVSVSITNLHKGTGENAKTVLFIEASEHFSLLSPDRTNLTISEGSDQTVSIRLKTNNLPGAAEIKFIVRGDGEESTIRSYLSVRPPTPYHTSIDSGAIKKGTEEIAVPRNLYTEFSTMEASVSYLPLGLARGLHFYLEKFPYGCTEQLASVTLPKLYPQLVDGLDMDKEEISKDINRTINILQTRQKESGGFGLWTARSKSHPVIDGHIMHFLTLARETGYYVPDTTFNRGIRQLITIAESKGTGMNELTDRSYAIYLLTLNEIITTSYIEKLTVDLKKNFEDWETSFCGLFLAGSYSLLQQDREANSLISKVGKSIDKNTYYEYYNHLCYPSIYLYMVSTYFPDRLNKISEELLLQMADEIAMREFSTFSANYALLGINAYLQAVPIAAKGGFTLTEKNGEEVETTLNPVGDRIFTVDYSEQAATIIIRNNDPNTLFYQITNAGFDAEIPPETHKGIEVFREYLDTSGKVTNKVQLGDLVTVRIRFRTLEGNKIPNIAIVDLVPAGLEMDIQSIRKAEKSGSFRPDYLDIREDRIVAFGTFNKDIQEFSYTARAINTGTFTVPPAFAESMYDQNIWSLRPMGPLTITK